MRKQYLHLLPSFKQASSCTVSSGSSILFWKDNWEGEILQQKFPELYSFAKNDSLSIKRFCAATHWTEHFHLPLSNQAFNQFTQLEEIIPELHHSDKDKWICNGQASKYSSMLMYNHLMGENEGHPIFKLIWNSSSRLKHKIFFWLVVHCRINTRSLLRRKGMHLDSPFCPNCNQNAEEPSCTCYGIVILHRTPGNL